MSLQDSRLRGLLRLRHQHEYTEARGEELAEERARFQRLAREDSAPRAVSSFNLFQTPEPLAARVVAALGGKTGRTLEPSAGLGRLYRALRAVDPSSPVVLVEQAAECCAELYRSIEPDTAARLIQADFLACDAERLGGLFDCVIMNPPFKQGRDVKHILHAAGLLAPGGRLVSLCANGPRQRAALRPIAATWEELPAGSFKSEGTGVDVVMLTIEA